MLCTNQAIEFKVSECPEISLDKKYLMHTRQLRLKKGMGQSRTIFCMQKEKKWLYYCFFLYLITFLQICLWSLQCCIQIEYDSYLYYDVNGQGNCLCMFSTSLDAAQRNNAYILVHGEGIEKRTVVDRSKLSKKVNYGVTTLLRNILLVLRPVKQVLRYLHLLIFRLWFYYDVLVWCLGHWGINCFCPVLEKFLPLFKHFCQVGVQIAQTAVHFAHFQVQARKGGGGALGCFVYVLIHKKGVWRLSKEQKLGAVFWTKWDPIWAKWDPFGQFVRKVGKSNLELGGGNSIILRWVLRVMG